MSILKNESVNKQPPVISIFFLTEMWERFGFYMIQSLLVLYMTSSVFGFSDIKSYNISAAFSALSYITPILGGYVASRILGYEHAITTGGILLAAGYALLSLHDPSLFYISLAVIAIGTGFFKPNISSYLGSFYQPEDPHREKGYTIFYVGINLGILLATLTAGYIVRYFGWHMPYLFASIGLCIGTLTFIFGLKILKKKGLFHRFTPSNARKNVLSTLLVYLNAVVFMLLAYEIIIHSNFANNLMLAIGFTVFLSLFYTAFQYKPTTRNKLIACLFLTLISIVFWAVYFQMFFSMNLFIKRAVDRQIFNLVLPTPIFLSLESIFIIILGIPMAMLWQKLSLKNKKPKHPIKILFIFIYDGDYVRYCLGWYQQSRHTRPNQHAIHSLCLFLFNRWRAVNFPNWLDHGNTTHAAKTHRINDGGLVCCTWTRD